MEEVLAETKGQKIPDMIKVIESSPDMAEVQRVVKPFTKPDGIGIVPQGCFFS